MSHAVPTPATIDEMPYDGRFRGGLESVAIRTGPLRCYHRVLQLLIRIGILEQFDVAFGRRKPYAPLSNQRRNTTGINSSREQSEQIVLG